MSRAMSTEDVWNVDIVRADVQGGHAPTHPSCEHSCARGEVRQSQGDRAGSSCIHSFSLPSTQSSSHTFLAFQCQIHATTHQRFWISDSELTHKPFGWKFNVHSFLGCTTLSNCQLRFNFFVTESGRHDRESRHGAGRRAQGSGAVCGRDIRGDQVDHGQRIVHHGQPHEGHGQAHLVPRLLGSARRHQGHHVRIRAGETRCCSSCSQWMRQLLSWNAWPLKPLTRCHEMLTRVSSRLKNNVQPANAQNCSTERSDMHTHLAECFLSEQRYSEILSGAPCSAHQCCAAFAVWCSFWMWNRFRQLPPAVLPLPPSFDLFALLLRQTKPKETLKRWIRNFRLFRLWEVRVWGPWIRSVTLFGLSITSNTEQNSSGWSIWRQWPKQTRRQREARALKVIYSGTSST